MVPEARYDVTKHFVQLHLSLSFALATHLLLAHLAVLLTASLHRLLLALSSLQVHLLWNQLGWWRSTYLLALWNFLWILSSILGRLQSCWWWDKMWTVGQIPRYVMRISSSFTHMPNSEINNAKNKWNRFIFKNSFTKNNYSNGIR